MWVTNEIHTQTQITASVTYEFGLLWKI